MHRLIPAGTLLLFFGAIYFLWQYRFERTPGGRTLHLAELRSASALPSGAEWIGPETRPRLRLRVDPDQPRKVVIRLDLPGIQAIDLLHLRFQFAATNLRPGEQEWEDGRCIIEWHSPSGGETWENNPVGSARYTRLGDIEEWVTRPDHPPAVPALRIENLGTAGDFELSIFEATVVRETLLWKIGRWVVMAAWLAWAVTWIGTRAGFIRSLLAASVWLVMGLYFVVPGPWKLYHSIGRPFPIGKEITSRQDSAVQPRVALLEYASNNSTALESVGKIPDQGDFTLRLKHYAANARPLLHMILVLAPALLTACLIGGKPARSLAVIFALAMEAAELAFGYGFDWGDMFDLACDGTGIVLALLVYRRLKRFTPLVAVG